ncbi:hypothetical protein C5O75_028955 [Burkholderia cepacia]|jgi:hypothetical protein|uniref:hypothetical protein n=1 Tax=Burkholderia cepacia TaxID=292 RepID=UPI0011B09FBE|nr:hypothetical protein [Burkholderia cepacia]KAB1587910.1 hypothetical protein C5O75_028955 [Burkholderia cepacia]
MADFTVVLWTFNRSRIPVLGIDKFKNKPIVRVSYHREYDDPVVHAYVTNLPEDIEDPVEKKTALGQWVREQARKQQYSEPEGSHTQILLDSIFKAVTLATRVEIEDPSQLPLKYR